MQHAIKRALTCAVCFSISSFAGADAGELETVVVTASRFPESALNAPIGMRIVTGEQIANSTARNLPEILANLGGVHVRNNSGSPDLQIDLRGFGIGADDNTLILVDGVRIEKPDLSTRALSALPLETIERIEILPGSGAVQYGAGATAGTINIVTKNPRPGDKQLSVLAGTGAFDTHEYSGTLMLGAKALSFNASARRYDTDNYRRNNDVSQSSATANLRWDNEFAHTSIHIGGDDQELGLPGERTEAQLSTDPRGTNSPRDRATIESRFATLNAGARFGDVELETDFSYRSGANDADYLSFGSTYSAQYDTSIIAPRLRWSIPSVAGISSQLVTGVDWVTTDWSAKSAGGFPSAGDAEQKSSAFYAMWFANLTETTRFNYGWRMQRMRNERRDVPPSAPTEIDENQNLYANEIALRQDLSRFLSAHIKSARSFRVANADENFGRAASGNLLKPQTAREIEAGIEFHADSIKISAVLFDIKLENEIAYSPLLFANTNLSPTRRRGVELNAHWQPLKTVTLGGTMSFLEATFRSGEYGGVDVSGNDVPLVPQRLANIYVMWKPFERTSVSANYAYVGKQRYDNDQANSYSLMPSYGLLGLRLSQESGDWTLAANVDNLFDKDYYSYGITNAFGCSTFCAYPQAGRTFFVSAAYRFH